MMSPAIALLGTGTVLTLPETSAAAERQRNDEVNDDVVWAPDFGVLDGSGTAPARPSGRLHLGTVTGDNRKDTP